jgi:histone H3/H4
MPANTTTPQNELADGAERKKRKYRLHPGTRALREIKKMQKSTSTLLPRASFQRLVQEILQDRNSTMSLRRTATDALQQAAEQYVVDLLKSSNQYAIHARRKTISVPDMKVAQENLADAVA